MDDINESSDLVAAQRAMEHENEDGNVNENEKEKETEKGKDNEIENGEEIENDPGNRTDDDNASDSGASRRSDIVDYTKSTEYKLLVKEFKQNSLCATRLQLKNSSALVRRVAVLLLEFLGTTTLNIDELLTSYVSTAIKFRFSKKFGRFQNIKFYICLILSLGIATAVHRSIAISPASVGHIAGQNIEFEAIK